MPTSRLAEEITERLHPHFPTSERTAKRVNSNRADQRYRPRHAAPEEAFAEFEVPAPVGGDTTAWASEWPVAGAPPAEVGDYTAAIKDWRAERVDMFPAWSPPAAPSRFEALRRRVAEFFAAVTRRPRVKP